MVQEYRRATRSNHGLRSQALNSLVRAASECEEYQSYRGIFEVLRPGQDWRRDVSSRNKSCQ
jgi:transposase InsO family protein